MKRVSWYRLASYAWLALCALWVFSLDQDLDGMRCLWAAMLFHQLDHIASERSRRNGSDREA